MSTPAYYALLVILGSFALFAFGLVCWIIGDTIEMWRQYGR